MYSIQNLLPSIIVLIIIWTERLHFWLNETWPFGKAKPSNILALVALILLKCKYLAKWFILSAVLLYINQYSHATAYYCPIIFLQIKLLVILHIDPGDIYWSILFYIFLFSLFLLVSIALTIINHISAVFLDSHVGRINLGTFDMALTFCCSGVSVSSMTLSSSISDSTSASQSSSNSFGLSKSPFQWSQFSVSERLSGALSSSLPAGWWSILFIWQTLNSWVCPPGRSFADKASGKGDLSDNLNAAAASYWKFG